MLLLAVGIVGGLVVRNIMRGGADSPEQAATKMIESVSNQDLVGAFLMVAPRERDAVVRVQEAFLKKYADLKIADAVGAASGQGEAGQAAAGAELSFEGIDVSVTGVQPKVTSISEDLAAVDLASGELRISVDPAKTRGVVRAGLASLAGTGTTEKYQKTFLLADLNLGSYQTGLTLIAKKTDGRWYISPMLSGLEAAHDASQEGDVYHERGTVPASVAKGADSEKAAASAAVLSLPRMLRDGVQALAPYLERDEAQALHLYGDTVPGLSSMSDGTSSFTVDSATFTPGPQDGNRAVAFVERISIGADSADSSGRAVTDTCLLGDESSKTCLNGSGFIPDSYGSGWAGLPLLADHGKFALTTVRGDDGWKVSLLDTAADHLVSWVNSLTREQALTYLYLERGDKTTGTLTVGTTSTVAFNSAGYAVMSFVAPQSQALEIGLDGDEGTGGLSRATVFGKDGRQVGDLLGSSAQVDAGTYTIVMKAGEEWANAFREQGNKVAFSAPVMIREYVEPATIDSSGGSATGSLSSFASGGQSFNVQIPDGNNVDLVLEITEASGDAAGGSIGIDVGGTSVPNSTMLLPGAMTTIPVTADSAAQTVTVWPIGLESYSAEIKYELKFVNK